jgi:hypothetical protein
MVETLRDQTDSTADSSRVLVIPIPGALRMVLPDGTIHEKPMTSEDFVWLAERCLVAGRERVQ